MLNRYQVPGSVLGTGNITMGKAGKDSTLLPLCSLCSYDVDRHKTSLVHVMGVMKGDTWDALGVSEKGKTAALEDLFEVAEEGESDRGEAGNGHRSDHKS